MARGISRKTKIVDGVQYNQCTKCLKWLPATKEYFYWKQKRNTLAPWCKKCSCNNTKVRREKNPGHRKEYMQKYLKQYYEKHKEERRNDPKLKEYAKERYKRNKEKIRQQQKEYYNNNQEKIIAYRKKYRSENPEYDKEYHKKHRKRIQNYYVSKAIFIQYADKLTSEEDPKAGPNGELLVKCTYCGEYFQPLVSEVKCRVSAMNRVGYGECRLYCSDVCKKACPLFNRYSPEAIERISGENSFKWKGGISAEPYCPIWIKSGFKENICERDNNQCQNPDCRKNSKRIAVHHINYIKKDCHPLNLIILCTSCNSRANANREYWQEFHTKIMNTKFKKDGMTKKKYKPIIKTRKETK